MEEETRTPLDWADNESDEQEGPFWTPQRIIYILIIIITLIAFLAYVLSPTISAVFGPPPPVQIPGPVQRV